MKQTSFNADQVEWRRITDPGSVEYKIDFEYSLMGFDRDAGRLDMLLRYAEGQGHCRRHRHVASTMTMVLEGEQHLKELQDDGSVKHILRQKGDYALAPTDAKPHLEHGGESGGMVFLSMWAPDGILFEYFAEDSSISLGTVSIDEYVASWNRGGVYGVV
ncbi:hypothetical protein N8Z26_03590 [Burkholderiales bacterium]|nr:hypothetical protein [Burkholderiales bacterium]